MKHYSRQREAIFNAVASSHIHPTASWVYENIKSIYPNISLGTVYRNLSAFVASGELIAVGPIHSKEYYDVRKDPHAHFVCTCCNQIQDIELDNQDAFSDYYEKTTGNLIQQRSIICYGICRKCRTVNEVS